MNRATTTNETAAYVRETLARDTSGHDWWHIERVWQTARSLAKAMEADLYVVELAALLHDIGDWKFHDGDPNAGSRLARKWLTQLKVEAATIDHVCQIIDSLSFKGAGVDTPMTTLEGAVVQDADRLDALGAIGIARAFAYGGHAGRPIHTPGMAPKQHSSFDEYKNSRGSTINHFYEKLLLLADSMNTQPGRELAEQRTRFMQEFLAQFYEEWSTAPR